MLELKDITFIRNNKVILDHVSLTLDNNRFVVITGQNGSGKSTLVKIIMGIEKPDSGRVIYNGIDITDMEIDERARLGIAFSFQQPVKFKGISVYDLIKLSSGKEIGKVEACKVLSKVGLCALDYINREVDSSLSGGELKRIEIATVAVRNAGITIFDEPEAGIDLWSFNKLIELFESIRKENQCLTIIISHQERILNIADELIIMNGGKIEKRGSFNEIGKNLEFSKHCCKIGGNE